MTTPHPCYLEIYGMWCVCVCVCVCVCRGYQVQPEEDPYANELHVGNIGVDGWDRTDAGVGTYESERALQEIFKDYGFVRATIRHKVKEGCNRSWALVTLTDQPAVDRALAANEASLLLPHGAALTVDRIHAHKSHRSGAKSIERAEPGSGSLMVEAQHLARRLRDSLAN